MQNTVGQPLRYATVCVTLSPEDVPEGFLRRVLSICAQKLGSGDVNNLSKISL